MRKRDEQWELDRTKGNEMNGLFDVTRTKKNEAKEKTIENFIFYSLSSFFIFWCCCWFGLVWFGCLCGSMHLYFVLFYVHDVVFVSITIFHGLHWNYRNVAIPRIFFIHFSASWVLCEPKWAFRSVVCEYILVYLCVRVCIVLLLSAKRFPKHWNKSRNQIAKWENC